MPDARTLPPGTPERAPSQRAEEAYRKAHAAYVAALEAYSAAQGLNYVERSAESWPLFWAAQDALAAASALHDRAQALALARREG